MYKAIFADIDGTLRDSNRIIAKRTVNAIKKLTEKGILVILCSGRPRKYTERISKSCHASEYIITSNGGEVYDYEKNSTIYINVMKKDTCLKLYDISKKAEVRFIMNVDGRSSYE